MNNDWILDVLADLKAFASRNGLSALADQLEDAAMIAAAEIASAEGRLPRARASDAGDWLSAADENA
jgi:hypothetical protein